MNCIAKRSCVNLIENKEDRRALYQKFYIYRVCVTESNAPPQHCPVHGCALRATERLRERAHTSYGASVHESRDLPGAYEMWLKVSILLDISQGMLHLHSRGIVHCDLAAHTPLLTILASMLKLLILLFHKSLMPTLPLNR